MKFQNIALCALVGLAALVVASAAQAAPARLVKAEGQVWVTPPNAEKELPASKGAELAAGTRVRTGPNGTAELQFENGSVINVRPNTSMSLSGKERPGRKNSVVLFFGRLWNKVTEGDSQHYEVKSANAVCGVRGTEFETAVADDGSVRVRVSKGEVAVGDGSTENGVGAGQEIAGDEGGLGAAGKTSGEGNWEEWQKEKRERLSQNSKGIVDKMKGKIMSRKDKLEQLTARKKEIEAKRKEAEQRYRDGDPRAKAEIEQYNKELTDIADAVADLGDEADSQFGIVDHFADLANDPKFAMIDRKYLVAEAASLRRIKKMFDQMVAEGTNISIEAMDDMLKDMSNGKRNTLKDKKGSTMDDLMGGDDPMK